MQPLCEAYDVPCIHAGVMPALLRGPIEEGELRLHAASLAKVRLLLPARWCGYAVGDDCYDLFVTVTGDVVRVPGSVPPWRIVVRVFMSGGEKCTLMPSQFAYALFLVAIGIHTCYEEDDGGRNIPAGKATMAAIRSGAVAASLHVLCSTFAIESAAYSLYLSAGKCGESRGHRHSLVEQMRRHCNAILRCKVENPWCTRLPRCGLRIEALGFISGVGAGGAQGLKGPGEKHAALARCAARYFAWVAVPDACGDEIFVLGLLHHGARGRFSNPPEALFKTDPVVKRLEVEF